MTDQKVWEYLESVEKLPAPANFISTFWNRVETKKRKNPGRKLASLTGILMLLVGIHLLSGFFHSPGIGPAGTAFACLNPETLIEESIHRFGLGEVASEVLTAEDILKNFATSKQPDHLPPFPEGGDWL
ncbi:MAG: hypothetical protein NC911_03230 [Candidatus Omnitrophica bacterium]|nr:hypothetical protein [Candidatus Omnitrophota bacterium]MCM8768681.1 hypothetical protein [Candidatus Omnitrophota bacterium]